MTWSHSFLHLHLAIPISSKSTWIRSIQLYTKITFHHFLHQHSLNMLQPSLYFISVTPLMIQYEVLGVGASWLGLISSSVYILRFPYYPNPPQSGPYFRLALPSSVYILRFPYCPNPPGSGPFFHLALGFPLYTIRYFLHQHSLHMSQPSLCLSFPKLCLVAGTTLLVPGLFSFPFFSHLPVYFPQYVSFPCSYNFLRFCTMSISRPRPDTMCLLIFVLLDSISSLFPDFC